MKGLRDYAAAERLVGRRVDRHIAEGDTLPLLAGVCIIDMPGHTLGSIALYVERVAAIIAGDSIVSAGGGCAVLTTARRNRLPSDRQGERSQRGREAFLLAWAKGRPSGTH